MLMPKHAMKNVASIFCGTETAILLCLFIKENRKHLPNLFVPAAKNKFNIPRQFCDENERSEFKTHWTLILCIGTLADIRKHQSVFIILLSRIILLFLSCKIILSSERPAISHNYLSFHTTMFIKCR